MKEGIVVGEFEKNTREVVRVSLTEYNGVDLCDIRAFYPKGGEMMPGKGLAIRRDQVTALRKVLQAAEKAIKDGGRVAASPSDDDSGEREGHLTA